MAEIFLKKHEEKRLQSGHLWVFSNEIERAAGDPQNGDTVEIYDSKNNFLGTGFYNKNSLISVRILSRGKIDNLLEYFNQKLKDAYKLRKEFYPSRESFRFVFSESDYLPGLIIDKYNNTFVLQVYSFGMQKNIELVVQILKDNYSAENIFTKNESYFRKLEGLPEEDEIFLGSTGNEIISDGTVNFKIDFEKGHKTGFYFDQCDNRLFVEKLCKGKSVADLFCNSGGFGLHAAKAGALSVVFVDSSGTEINNAKNNFALNELTCSTEFIASDIFDFLEKNILEKKKYDIVIIDPPAFAKSKKNLSRAKKGYEKLNRLAMQVINNDGYLVSSSCSHHLKSEEFLQIINQAAAKAGKSVQLVEFSSAGSDHPRIPSMPETEYLKFAVLRVLS